MPSPETSRPRPRRARLALVAALVAVGCSGGNGGGCGSSCGGAFKTKNPDGTPIKFTGSRLDNVAQVRVIGREKCLVKVDDRVGALAAPGEVLQHLVEVRVV